MQLDIPFQLENFIDGRFCPTTSGANIDNINPATGAVYGKIPNSDEADINKAVEAAKKAFKNWSITPSEIRFKILNRMAE